MSQKDDFEKQIWAAAFVQGWIHVYDSDSPPTTLNKAVEHALMIADHTLNAFRAGVRLKINCIPKKENWVKRPWELAMEDERKEAIKQKIKEETDLFDVFNNNRP